MSRRSKDCILKNPNSTKRENRYFGYFYTDRLNKSGNRIRKKVQGATIAEVEAKIKAARGEENIIDVKDLLFNDCFKYGFESYENKSIKTKNLFETIFKNQIAKFYSGIKIVDIKPELVKESIKKWSTNYSHSTAKKAFQYSRKIFNDTNLKFGNVLNNPFIGIKYIDFAIKKGNTSKANDMHFSDEMARLIIAELKNTKYPEICPLLWGTGLRINELLGLQWPDLDFENELIHVRRILEEGHDDNGWRIFDISLGKTQAGIRKVPMLYGAKKHFLQIKKRDENSSCDIIFHTKNNTYMAYSNYARTFRAAINRLQTKGQLHMFRHNYVIDLLNKFSEKGPDTAISLHDIAVVTGHTDEYMTFKYDDEKNSKAIRVKNLIESSREKEISNHINNKSLSLKEHFNKSRREMINSLYVAFDNGEYSSYNQDDILKYFVWKFSYFEKILTYMVDKDMVRVSELHSYFLKIPEYISESNAIEHSELIRSHSDSSDSEHGINLDSIHSSEIWKKMGIQFSKIIFIQEEFDLFMNFEKYQQ